MVQYLSIVIQAFFDNFRHIQTILNSDQIKSITNIDFIKKLLVLKTILNLQDPVVGVIQSHDIKNNVFTIISVLEKFVFDLDNFNYDTIFDLIQEVNGEYSFEDVKLWDRNFRNRPDYIETAKLMMKRFRAGVINFPIMSGKLRDDLEKWKRVLLRDDKEHISLESE